MKEDQLYAIKKVNLQEMSERDCQATELEVELLQKLRHTNIVTYKDSFIDEKNFFNIVMVYCSEGDLYTKIQNKRGGHFQEEVPLINFTL